MSAMFLAMVWHARRRQHALQAVEQLADERASLLERQERFLHDASHELRTPVTIARGHLEVLERPGERAQEMTSLSTSSRGSSTSSSRLLLLAKAEHPDFVACSRHRRRAVPGGRLPALVRSRPRVLAARHLPVGTLRADPEALRSALDALLENAVKHTEAADPVELRAEPRAATVAIAVSDDGSGIPRRRSTSLRALRPRRPGPDRAEGGVGLGLAIVDAIAKAHGGAARSKPRSGSTFTLRCPVRGGADAVEAPELAPAPAPPAGSRLGMRAASQRVRRSAARQAAEKAFASTPPRR